MSTFCQRSYNRKCQLRGIGGQKSTNLVNVVCERPLITKCLRKSKMHRDKITPSKMISSHNKGQTISEANYGLLKSPKNERNALRIVS